MSKIVKEVAGLPFWERPEPEQTAFTAVKHDPLEKVYIPIINPHDAYPTETCGGYCKTLEEAEQNRELQIYGGKIKETTWGELETITYI